MKGDKIGKFTGILGLILAFSFQSCAQQSSISENKKGLKNHTFEVQKTEDEWKEILDPLEFKVLREAGTERAFTGKYNDF